MTPPGSVGTMMRPSAVVSEAAVSTRPAERLRVPLSTPQACADTGAVCWSPPWETGQPGLVLAHGAGTDVTDSVLCAVGRGLANRGHPVFVFNFPFAEVGRKRPDPQSRLEAAYRDAATAAAKHLGDRPLVLGGRSLGGRMASHLAAEGWPCAGLVLLGYPLHPIDRPERLRTGHWPALEVPVLFVQGDRDRLCDLDLFSHEREARLAAPSRLHVIPGADHGFAVRQRDGRSLREVLDEVVDAVADWLCLLGDEQPAVPHG